jgi:predicted RND superfamily exporter protein
MIRLSKVAERPGLALAYVGVFTGLLAAGLPRLRIDTSIETMIVDGDSDRQAFEEKKRIFGNDEVIAVAIPYGDALSRAALASQRQITSKIEEVPGVVEVESLTNTDDIVGDGEALRVDPLVPSQTDPARLDDATISRIRERVEANRLWTGFLISRDRQTAALAVHVEDESAEGSARVVLMARLDDVLRSQLGERPYHLAGHPFMKTEIGAAMQRDLSTLLPVSLLLMALLLRLGTGSWKVSFAILGTAVLTVIWMLGAMGWADQPLTAIATSAPTILLALATAYLMHFAAAFQRQLNLGKVKGDASAAALEEYAMPVVMASLTTAIGFISLSTSSVRIVRGFGIDLSLGVCGIVVLGLIALPAFFALAPVSKGKPVFATSARWSRVLGALTGVSLRRPGSLVTMSLVSGAIAACFALTLEVDSSGPKRFSEESRFRRSAEFYREHMSGDVVGNVYLKSGFEGFLEPDRLNRVLALQHDLEAMPEIDATLSIAGYVALMNRAIHADDPASELIPDSREAVAQLLLLHSSSGDPEAFNDLISPDYDQLRIITKATVMSSKESALLREKMRALVAKHFPECEGPDSVLSTEIMLSKAADTLSREQLQSFGGAMLVILIAIMLGFRSVKAAALMVLPNGLPIILNLGIMGFLRIPLNETTSLISAIALGVGVDSTVHILAAVRRGEEANGSRRGSLVKAMLAVGRPVMLTSLVVIAGFAVLLLSDFQTIAEMGGLMALTMVFCLGMDLFVTPAQLVAWYPAEVGDAAIVHAERGSVAGVIDQEEKAGLAVRLLGDIPPLRSNEPVILDRVSRGVQVIGKLEVGSESDRIWVNTSHAGAAPLF